MTALTLDAQQADGDVDVAEFDLQVAQRAFEAAELAVRIAVRESFARLMDLVGARARALDARARRRGAVSSWSRYARDLRVEQGAN